MKENVLAIISVIALILSVTAVVLEINYQNSEIEPSKIKGVAWTSDNDGLLSGLDADKLDNLDSSQFLRKDLSDSINGDLHINGTISYNSVTHYYTMPSSAFEAIMSDYSFSNAWSILTNRDPRFYSQRFNAPINLPDGAQVKKIIIAYFNNDPSAEINLNLYSRGVNFFNVIEEISLPKNSDFEPTTSSLPYSELNSYEQNVTFTIDNNRNAYYIDLELHPNDSEEDVVFSWICFEYTITNP